MGHTVGGTLKTGTNTNDVTILWGDGGQNFDARALYLANANYKWISGQLVKITPTAGSVTTNGGPAFISHNIGAQSYYTVDARGDAGARFQTRRRCGRCDSTAYMVSNS